VIEQFLFLRLSSLSRLVVSLGGPGKGVNWALDVLDKFNSKAKNINLIISYKARVYYSNWARILTIKKYENNLPVFGGALGTN
jgi:hypothetical protein